MSRTAKPPDPTTILWSRYKIVRFRTSHSGTPFAGLPSRSCCGCGHPIAAGAEVRWGPRSRLVIHDDCVPFREEAKRLFSESLARPAFTRASP